MFNKALPALAVLALINAPDCFAHDVSFSRLSSDSNNPLYYAVMVGNPMGDHVAFLHRRTGNCVLDVSNLTSGRVVASLVDRQSCQVSGDAEDGSGALAANQFAGFVRNFGATIKQLLRSFQIQHDQFRFPSVPHDLRTDADGRTCLKVNSAQVCAADDLVVSRDK